MDNQHLTSTEKIFKISQQLNAQGPHLSYLPTGIPSEIQAGPPLTCGNTPRMAFSFPPFPFSFHLFPFSFFQSPPRITDYRLQLF